MRRAIRRLQVCIPFAIAIAVPHSVQARDGRSAEKAKRARTSGIRRPKSTPGRAKPRKHPSKKHGRSRTTLGRRKTRLRHRTPRRQYRYDPTRKSVVPMVVSPKRKPKPNELPLGATPWGRGVGFLIWAPKAKKLDLVVDKVGTFAMKATGKGYYYAFVDSVGPGSLYGYKINGEGATLPDPVSYRQPNGVFGMSEVVDHTQFRWTDAGWRGLPLSRMDITEVHVGTLTRQGTLKAGARAIKSLVTNTVELMPVHQFSGKRNWGYDPSQLFAVQNSYGTPNDLRRLVNSAHRANKAVLMDVVYNHSGPVGAFSGSFAPYFEKGKTPWGGGVSVAGPKGREIARHFIENALMWVNAYHLDGLRVDATVYLPDALLKELSRAIAAVAKKTGRKIVLISEHNRNDRRVTAPVSKGGHGFDGQWSMDLQYALRALLAGERGGRIDHYAKDPFRWVSRAVAHGWAYEGQRPPSQKARFGSSTDGIAPSRFVVAKDDHDQIGNTPRGQRLGNRVGPGLDRAIDALYGFMPFTVMNFQGDEYRAPQTFDFFVDVKEPLAGQIRAGRNREWAPWLGDRKFRDPNAVATFKANKLNPKDRRSRVGRQALALSRELFGLRARHPVLKLRSAEQYQVVRYSKEQVLMQHRWSRSGASEIIALTNLSNKSVTIDVANRGEVERSAKSRTRRPVTGIWGVLLSTEEKRFGGGERGPKRNDRIDLRAHPRITLPPQSAVYLQKTKTR